MEELVELCEKDWKVECVLDILGCWAFVRGRFVALFSCFLVSCGLFCTLALKSCGLWDVHEESSRFLKGWSG